MLQKKKLKIYIRKFTWKNRLFKIIRELIYSKMLMKEE